jgi:hypothetical protein
MTDVKEIEAAVARLKPDELEVFRAWFDEFLGAELDRRIERDGAAGRLDRLAAEAEEEHRAGRTREMGHGVVPDAPQHEVVRC